jgi:uncharacterized membrane protein YfcA
MRRFGGVWHAMDGPGFLPLFGLIAGVLVGLTGMGGGVLMTPLLMLGLGLPASAAVATDLLYSAPTKLIGGWQHWRQGTVDGRIVRDLATGSLPASLLAVGVVAVLQSGHESLANRWLQQAIGIAMILGALLLLQRLIRQFGGLGHTATSNTLPRPYRRGWVISVGAVGGFLVGLTSIGSGSLIIAMLVLVVSMDPSRLVGTDVMHAAMLVSTAAVAHLFLGHAHFGMAFWLLTGSIPGVLLGSRLAVYTPRSVLQVVLVVLLISTAVKLL